MPEAQEDLSSEWAVVSMGTALVAMMAFQQWIS